MADEATIRCVADEITRRLTVRLGPMVHEDPYLLHSRLAALDGWTLCTLLRVTADAHPAERRSKPRHRGVVGVDHSLNRLVVEGAAGSTATGQRLDAVELDTLDDDDLIAAAHYVPETLPGYMLG